MEKIIIVTVYNSENSGSYLQAYALGQVLKSQKYEVAYYKRPVKGTSHAIKPHIIWSLKKLAKLRLKSAIYPLKTWWTYHQAQKEFTICDSQSVFYKEAKTVIIGSDTLWNFSSDYFANKSQIYTGKKFADKTVLTYAVSAANTTEDKFTNVVNKDGGLEHIKRILVRDIHTQKLVAKVTDKTADIVCDPTLLLAPQDYDILYKEPYVREPYLLLYYFGRIENQHKSVIVKFAEEHCLKIVSLMEVRSWADYCTHSSPSNMISYFKNADCIVTNTFHGTAFSLIYGKPFAVHNHNNNKVNELLNFYQQGNRLFLNPENIPSLLSLKNDVHESGLYERMKNNSIEILKNTLK